MDHKANILVLGSKGVGIKTLLHYAQLERDQQDVAAFTLWHNKAARFIVPNTHFDQNTYEKLRQLTKKIGRAQSLQAVLLVIDIPSVLNQDAVLAIAQQFSEQLNRVRKLQKKFDLNLIFTKCDRLVGFKEFFAYLNAAERQKIFGTQGELDFEPLLKKLNAQVITRLHQETIAEKRSLIPLFPAQFGKLTEYITLFITSLSANTALHIKDVYFTSCKQKDKSLDLLGKRETVLPPTILDKPYFVDHMMAQICKEAQTTKLHAKRFDKKRWIALPLCMVIIIILIMTWHLSYRHTSQALNKIEAQLQQAPSVAVKPPWLARLNLLSMSITQLNDPSLKYSRLIGFSQTSTLQKKLTLLYNTQLHTQFLPYIEGILADSIVQSMQNDKLKLYDALKIYLMLTTQSHYDQKTIVNWFTLYWQQHDKKTIQQQKILLQHLKNLLRLQDKNWPRDQPLINQAQQVLQSLPSADIIFLELQGYYKNQRVPLSSMLQTNSNLDLTQLTIPRLFNPANFKEIYNHQIPELVSLFDQGNWVIGKPAAISDTPQTQDTLIANVRALYLQSLSQTWQALIPKIKLKTPANFADIQSLINEMTNPQSSLMALLEFASGNANLTKQAQPVPTLQAVSQFLAHKAIYSQSVSALQTLSDYLKPIVSSDDLNKASYNMAIAILNNPTQANPIGNLRHLHLSEPIQSWLNTIADGAWAIMLTHSRSYLETVWTSSVVPVCDHKINNRYPFVASSNEDISLDNFSNFVGPNGTIDVFFNYYLKPFVDMHTNYWVWQKRYGQSIAFSQSILDMFMRASLIQQMFFADTDQHPSFKLSLIPLSKSHHIRAITLNIEGQEQTYTDSNQSSTILTWPGTKPNQVTLHATFDNAKPITLSFNGPWALFRLIQSATLIPLANPQKYVLQFKLGTALAAYHLIADNRINPFIPGVLTNFTCPNISPIPGGN